MRDNFEIIGINGIVAIKKYIKGCMFCGREKVLINYRGFKVCMNCISLLELMREEEGNGNESRGYH